METQNNFVLGGHHLADGDTWVGPTVGLEAYRNGDGTATIGIGMWCEAYHWTFTPDQLDAFIEYLQTGKIETIGQMGRINKAADYVEPAPRESIDVVNARLEAEGSPLRVKSINIADLINKAVFPA